MSSSHGFGSGETILEEDLRENLQGVTGLKVWGFRVVGVSVWGSVGLRVRNQFKEHSNKERWCQLCRSSQLARPPLDSIAHTLDQKEEEQGCKVPTLSFSQSS